MATITKQDEVTPVVRRAIEYWYFDPVNDVNIQVDSLESLIQHVSRDVATWLDLPRSIFVVVYLNRCSSAWATKAEADRAANQLTDGGFVIEVPLTLRSGI
jgi:hypothetical protein